MEHQLDRRTLSRMVAGLTILPGVAVVAIRSGMAQEASPEASPAASPAAGATPDAGANEATIGSYDIYFDPKEVTIAAGVDVTIILPNHGAAGHNFSITDHKNENLQIEPISIDIAPGDTQEVTINAPAGEYYFFCDIPGHEAAGMWGTLTVE